MPRGICNREIYSTYLHRTIDDRWRSWETIDDVDGQQSEHRGLKMFLFVEHTHRTAYGVCPEESSRRGEREREYCVHFDSRRSFFTIHSEHYITTCAQKNGYPWISCSESDTSCRSRERVVTNLKISKPSARRLPIRTATPQHIRRYFVTSSTFTII